MSLYIREIRLADGSIIFESLAIEYTTILHPGAGIEDDVEDYHCRLYNENNEELGQIHSADYSSAVSSMPSWWNPPSSQKVKKLIASYQETEKPIPATNNVVTFAVYRENGAMMGQFRTFVSPANNPILDPGMPSMHGGVIDQTDFQYLDKEEDESDADWYKLVCKSAVLRENSEEFGVDLDIDDLTYVGDVYDADTARFNHVYRVTKPYEQALKETYGTNIDGMLKAIFDCEGLGRFTRMFKEDLERAIEIGAITPISIAILKAFPQLMPPPAPMAE